MSHPDPSKDYYGHNEKGSMRSGTGGLEKKTRKMLNLNEMLTSDHKASVKAGKKNAKSAALKAKTSGKGLTRLPHDEIGPMTA